MTKRACFKGIVLVCAIALFGFIQPVVFAQLTTAGIVGTVSDPSGSRIPGVTVTALQVETSTPTTTTTDSSGNYSFTNLQIGKYSITFQKEGFQRIVQSNVDLGIGQVVRFDIALQVGSVSQTVEVTDAPPLLQTETSSLGTIETEKRIVDLPLNGRNFFKLTYLGPGTNEGATGTSAGAGSTDNNRPGTAVSVNGLRIFDNNFLLNGMDNNEFGNGTVVIQPPPDSIQEFRIEQNSMSAEFGRGGAMISVVLRSGTNQLHGAAWEFLRNNKFDALNYFATKSLGFQQNQYGGQLGGPIVKDKMFLFGSIQRTDIRKQTPFISTVPTLLMHSGNFSELRATSSRRALSLDASIVWVRISSICFPIRIFPGEVSPIILFSTESTSLTKLLSRHGSTTTFRLKTASSLTMRLPPRRQRIPRTSPMWMEEPARARPALWITKCRVWRST